MAAGALIYFCVHLHRHIIALGGKIVSRLKEVEPSPKHRRAMLASQTRTSCEFRQSIVFSTSFGNSISVISRNFSIRESARSSVGRFSNAECERACCQICGLYRTRELSMKAAQKCMANSDKRTPFNGWMALVWSTVIPPASAGNSVSKGRSFGGLLRRGPKSSPL
jgi:hypothetical protein